MPNVIIEHSSDITESKPLIQLCHDHLMQSGLFKLETIKVRSHRFDDYLVGGELDKTFCVISLTVMPGKSQEQKCELGDSLHQKVINACLNMGLKAATSVVVKETPQDLYFKNNS